MGAFLKKDILVVVRDRTELLVLLLMPFLLIVILGFALRGVMGGDTEALQMKVAIVQQDDEQQGVKRFVKELEERPLPEEVSNHLQQTAVSIRPYTRLQDVLNAEGVSDMIETVELDASVAEQALKEEEVAAILTVPEHFTYLSLQKMLLDEGKGGKLHITVDDYRSLSTKIFHDIVESFVRSLNFETAVVHALREDGGSLSSNGLRTEESVGIADLGGVITVSKRDPVSSFQYYTLSMAVMFVLFVASTMSGKAHVEKLQHVMNRILLSGRHPLVYLGGKVVSATVLAFVQLFVLFSLSTLVLQTFIGETVDFWLGMAVITAVLSLCVGTLAALLTALTVRFNSAAVTYVFAGGIVSIFAIVGGSFFPISGLPDVVQSIGHWTPNGAALSAYLQWVQGMDGEALFLPLSRLAGASILFLAAGVLIFPQRRSV
ncbi:ABC transporter permease [Desmospora profundinema]|uniref:ABC-2 type transport system permease protein n=1 Tax=Desmospora profundinema TaxID=1571184 RepID=A0ABU1IJB3_9BACL|nr:ABC transporter permease [Desmospora profundinema]MDR6224843.1 ABC-2 type transport system permease protein [Desmospora profundinema]